jgi:arylformamidase
MQLTADFCGREYNNRALVPNFAEIFARWTEDSSTVRRRHKGTFNLAYGSSAAERLDLFPSARNGAPLFVFFHGGYWRSLDKNDFSFIAPPYLDEGVSVAVPNYALAPSVAIDEIVIQSVRSLAWLYRNASQYGFDRSRIYIGGHSAGGHLVATLLCTQWPTVAENLPADLVKGGVAVSGLYDLEPIVYADFLNVDLKLDFDSARRLSPAFMQPATNAPIVTAVGGEESSEFKRQNAMIPAHWPRNFRADVPMPGFNHMTVCNQLAHPDSPLFRAAAELCLKG